MDKGKGVLRRADNQRNQQGTFNRKCDALFAQANEFAARQDAEVGIIVFSSNGDMIINCNESSSLERIIDRYKSRTCSGALHHQQYIDLKPEGSIHGDLMELRDGINHIGHSLLHYTSRDNWMHMKMKDMDKLERELRSAITEVQVRKDQLVQQELQALQKKEHMLAEENERMYNLIRSYEMGQQQMQQQQDQQDLLKTMMMQSSSQHQAQNDVLNQFPFAGEDQPSMVLHLATLQPLFDPHQQQNMDIKTEDRTTSFRGQTSDFNTSFNPPRL
uniref:Uncharacterized protein n=1 Tax=Kalanchoe fedtschenkoi TaxID=63787 RepID=A0A7N0UJ64_KALFE